MLLILQECQQRFVISCYKPNTKTNNFGDHSCPKTTLEAWLVNFSNEAIEIVWLSSNWSTVLKLLFGDVLFSSMMDLALRHLSASSLVSVISCWFLRIKLYNTKLFSDPIHSWSSVAVLCRFARGAQRPFRVAMVLGDKGSSHSTFQWPSRSSA